MTCWKEMGITGNDDDRGSVLITHMNLLNIYMTVLKKTHTVNIKI